MARMWRGPCEALKKASGDPLWAAIHRRNGRLGISCDLANDGRTANFYKLARGRDGEWYRTDLGRVEGVDPYLVSLWGSHDFAGFHAELLALHHQYLERLAEEIGFDCSMIVRKLGGVVDEFVS